MLSRLLRSGCTEENGRQTTPFSLSCSLPRLSWPHRDRLRLQVEGATMSDTESRGEIRLTPTPRLQVGSEKNELIRERRIPGATGRPVSTESPATATALNLFFSNTTSRQTGSHQEEERGNVGDEAPLMWSSTGDSHENAKTTMTTSRMMVRRRKTGAFSEFSAMFAGNRTAAIALDCGYKFRAAQLKAGGSISVSPSLCLPATRAIYILISWIITDITAKLHTRRA